MDYLNMPKSELIKIKEKLQCKYNETGSVQIKYKGKINEKSGVFKMRKPSFKFTKFVVSINENVHNKFKSV